MTDALIRHIESQGYAVNRMTLLLKSGRRYRFTAWPASASSAEGVFGSGEYYAAEADDPGTAARQLAQQVGAQLPRR